MGKEQTATGSCKQTGKSLLRKNVRFRLMFAAHAVASFGDWFDAIAIQVLVAYRWGADPMLIALIPVVMALPGLLLGSFAGTLADRVNRAKLLMGCDIIVALFTIGILAAPGPAWLLPLLGLRAAAGVFQMPSQQGLTRAVVPMEEILRATSLNGLVNQGSKVAGPMLGAMTLAVLSPQACILLNALSRLSSCALLWPLRRVGARTAAPEDNKEGSGQPKGKLNGFWAQWQEGWTFLLRSRLLLNTLVFGLVGLTAILMIDYQFPTLLRVILPGNESVIGWLISAIGAGAVGSILVLNRLERVSAGWGLGGGAMLIGGAIAALGWMKPGAGTIMLLVIGVFIGIGNGLYMITQNYILQKGTPEALVGRVFGIQSTATGVIMIVAPLAGGILIRTVGPGAAFVWIGLCVSLLGLLGVLLRSVIWTKSPLVDAIHKVSRESPTG